MLKQLNDDHRSDGYTHYMAKRRFLPTRRDLHGYINEDFSSENNDDDDEAHLNSKRYFLKSKRYFLNSKREDVGRFFSNWIVFRFSFLGMKRSITIKNNCWMIYHFELFTFFDCH